MIPPKLVNKNRGKKPLLRRKEANEDNTGFTNGNVRRNGIIITCSIYGISRHNIRYHGVQLIDYYNIYIYMYVYCLHVNMF